MTFYTACLSTIFPKRQEVIALFLLVMMITHPTSEDFFWKSNRHKNVNVVMQPHNDGGPVSFGKTVVHDMFEPAHRSFMDIGGLWVVGLPVIHATVVVSNNVGKNSSDNGKIGTVF